MGINPEDAAAHCQLASLSLEARLVARGNNHHVKLSGVNSWEMRVLYHDEPGGTELTPQVALHSPWPLLRAGSGGVGSCVLAHHLHPSPSEMKHAENESTNAFADRLELRDSSFFYKQSLDFLKVTAPGIICMQDVLRLKGTRTNAVLLMN